MADLYQDTLVPYNNSIGSLYENLKNTYKGTAQAGLDFQAQMAQHLNDNVAKSQASTTSMFDQDQASLANIAARTNAPDTALAGNNLQNLRDRLLGVADLAKSAAADRSQYIGNIQSQYMNRLGDSASATGAMYQAALISAIGKIKADNDAKMALAAQQAALARAASARRSGGGGGGSSAGTPKATTTTTGQALQFSGLDQATQRYIQDAVDASSPGGWAKQATDQNKATQKLIDYWGVDTPGQSSARAMEYRAANVNPQWAIDTQQLYPAAMSWYNKNLSMFGPLTKYTLNE